MEADLEVVGKIGGRHEVPLVGNTPNTWISFFKDIHIKTRLLSGEDFMSGFTDESPLCCKDIVDSTPKEYQELTVQPKKTTR